MSTDDAWGAANRKDEAWMESWHVENRCVSVVHGTRQPLPNTAGDHDVMHAVGSKTKIDNVRESK